MGIYHLTNRFGCLMINLKYFVLPLAKYIPEVEHQEIIPRNDRARNQIYVLLMYIICSQLPLYGAIQKESSIIDKFLKQQYGSSKGTLFEFGLFPVNSISYILRLIINMKIFNLDMSVAEDRQVYDICIKFGSILLTLSLAVMQWQLGYFGATSELGMINSVLIISQLTCVTTMLIYLDDVSSRGWNLVSSNDMYICSIQCETLIWGLLSPVTLKTRRGTEFQGILIETLYTLLIKDNKIKQLSYLLTRKSGPNLTEVFATYFIAILCLDVMKLKVDIPLANSQYRGGVRSWSYHLMRNQSLVGYFAQAYYQIQKVSWYLNRTLPTHIITRMIGMWNHDTRQPEGGLIYWITACSGVFQVYKEPFRAFTYACGYLSMCLIVSNLESRLMSTSRVDLARTLRDRGLVVRGASKSSLLQAVSSYTIPTQMCGALAIGAIAVFSDYTNSIVKGQHMTSALQVLVQIYDAYNSVTSDSLMRKMVSAID